MEFRKESSNKRKYVILILEFSVNSSKNYEYQTMVNYQTRNYRVSISS